MLFSEEIQRQLEASNSKAIIGTPKTFTTIKEAVQNSKKDIKIICIKTEADESIPSGAIDFADLIETKSKECTINEVQETNIFFKMKTTLLQM